MDLTCFLRKGGRAQGAVQEGKRKAVPTGAFPSWTLAPTSLQASAVSGSSYSEKSCLHEAGPLFSALDLNNH